jgi:two-component system, cell cycle sensor histidine kinase and response regulator CckA
VGVVDRPSREPSLEAARSEYVLVVEDDGDLRELIAYFIRTQSDRGAVTVSNGREALDTLRGSPRPAAIVLDLRMPVMDGWRFRVQQKSDPALSGIPVVAISADRSSQAAAVDACAVVSKPFRADDLLEAINEAIAAHESRTLAMQRAQADRMALLGRLAASVAHEINNPLAYILMNLTLIERELPLLEAVPDAPPGAHDDRVAALAELVREVRDGNERIAAIVRAIATFARGEEDAPALVDVHEGLEAAVKLAEHEIKHRARLVREYGEAPAVFARKGQLGQVFLNLLINAAQAIPEGRVRDNEIRLITSTDDRGWAVIEVADTGSGIPARIRGRVFEPFFTTKRGTGTGLGLSICRDIVVDRLGGSLSLDTEPSRGTVVRVALPPPNQVAAPVAERPSQPRLNRGDRARILLIDDEPAIERAVARVLGKHHIVVCATSGRYALELIESGGDFAAVICDLNMPDVGGIDVYRRLEATGNPLRSRVVFMTGGAFTSQGRSFIGCVDAPMLAKPFTSEELLDAIDRVLVPSPGPR